MPNYSVGIVDGIIFGLCILSGFRVNILSRTAIQFTVMDLPSTERFLRRPLHFTGVKFSNLEEISGKVKNEKLRVCGY